MLQKKKKYEEKNEGAHMWATVQSRRKTRLHHRQPTPPFHLASCRHLRYMRMFRAPITTITNPPDKAD